MAQPINSFNSVLAYVQNKFYQWAGEDTLRGQLVRSNQNYKDFKLTAAQMDALNATPVSVLPAPGVGLANVIDSIVLFVDAGATPFELGSGVLEFRYTDGSGAKVVTDIANAVVESATDAYGNNPGIVAAVSLNAAVVAHASADVTAGDGAIYGRIFYHTVNPSELA